MRKFARLFVLAALAVMCTSTAMAEELGGYILKDGKVYRVQDGEEKLLEDEPVNFANTDAGMYGWVLVDPEFEGMAGSKSGIHFFFGDDNEPFAFLPMKDAAACMMEFSPSGEKVLISRGTEIKQDLGYYEIDIAGKKFNKKKSFVSAGHSFWVDPHRFFFTSVDESKGARDNAGDQLWDSIAMYDSVFDELSILKEATETKDYFITGCDYDKGTVDVSESSVKNKKDWNNQDKIEYKELTVPIPAAG
jgi:hypothetical protein